MLCAYIGLTCLCQSFESSEMGKNKGGKNKVNAVFRVAGGKAAKAKKKAQPVATNLKKVFSVSHYRIRAFKNLKFMCLQVFVYHS